MAPGRYSNTPLKTVDDIYRDYVESLARENTNEHVITYLSMQSEEWGRLYPQTHAVTSAAISGRMNSAERPSSSRSETGEASMASVGHQPPQGSLDSPITSEMRRGDLMQDPSTDSINRVIAPAQISERDDSGEVPRQSQSGTRRRSRYGTAFRGHQLRTESLSSPTTGDLIRDDLTEEKAANPDTRSNALKKNPKEARDQLVQELESLVTEYGSEMPAWSSDGRGDDEHVRTFLTRFTEKIQRFRETLQHSLNEISKMELSPILNVSELSMINANVLHAGIDVELLWSEFTKCPDENPTTDMKIMTHHYARCWQYFAAYVEANQTYLNTLSDDFYPRERKNFGKVI